MPCEKDGRNLLEIELDPEIFNELDKLATETGLSIDKILALTIDAVRRHEKIIESIEEALRKTLA
ncbi:hypothetical protein A2T98_03280 [Nodularia spumigena CENA596]|uniref:Uncharacterized protein n=1 Tax=Nodularia spumigena CENA596 TaxID=1819295 RepID=A0A166KJS8_NODSP|nr:hypothetical protein [Nodularia spumigena]KZL51228.1 hypothetical protein A2T98_03280 [Nodularia spumigena CENA596]